MQVASKHYSDKDLLVHLKKGSEKAFSQVYHQGYRPVERYITQNSGSIDDAKDIFQEALFVLVKKLRDPEFVLTVKPTSYLSAIVKKMWLYKIRGNKGKTTISIDDEDKPLEIADIVEESDYEEKHHLMEKVFTKIGEDCQKLLRAFYFEKKNMEEIASLMDYTVAFVRVKKHRCMTTFKKKIKEQ